MKKKLLVVITIISIVILPSCGIVQNYACPGIYQVPANMKAIPSKYERLKISKLDKDRKKRQRDSLKKSSKFGNKRYSYR